MIVSSPCISAGHSLITGGSTCETPSFDDKIMAVLRRFRATLGPIYLPELTSLLSEKAVCRIETLLHIFDVVSPDSLAYCPESKLFFCAWKTQLAANLRELQEDSEKNIGSTSRNPDRVRLWTTIHESKWRISEASFALLSREIQRRCALTSKKEKGGFSAEEIFFIGFALYQSKYEMEEPVFLSYSEALLSFLKETPPKSGRWKPSISFKQLAHLVFVLGSLNRAIPDALVAYLYIALRHHLNSFKVKPDPLELNSSTLILCLKGLHEIKHNKTSSGCTTIIQGLYYELQQCLERSAKTPEFFHASNLPWVVALINEHEIKPSNPDLLYEELDLYLKRSSLAAYTLPKRDEWKRICAPSATTASSKKKTDALTAFMSSWIRDLNENERYFLQSFLSAMSIRETADDEALYSLLDVWFPVWQDAFIQTKTEKESSIFYTLSLSTITIILHQFALHGLSAGKEFFSYFYRDLYFALKSLTPSELPQLSYLVYAFTALGERPPDYIIVALHAACERLKSEDSALSHPLLDLLEAQDVEEARINTLWLPRYWHAFSCSLYKKMTKETDPFDPAKYLSDLLKKSIPYEEEKLAAHLNELNLPSLSLLMVTLLEKAKVEPSVSFKVIWLKTVIYFLRNTRGGDAYHFTPSLLGNILRCLSQIKEALHPIFNEELQTTLILSLERDEDYSLDLFCRILRYFYLSGILPTDEMLACFENTAKKLNPPPESKEDVEITKLLTLLKTRVSDKDPGETTIGEFFNTLREIHVGNTQRIPHTQAKAKSEAAETDETSLPAAAGAGDSLPYCLTNGIH